MQVVLKAADGTIVASNGIPNGEEGDPGGNTITLPFTYSPDVHKRCLLFIWYLNPLQVL